jgi:hypothetical protein
VRAPRRTASSSRLVRFFVETAVLVEPPGRIVVRVAPFFERRRDGVAIRSRDLNLVSIGMGA